MFAVDAQKPIDPAMLIGPLRGKQTLIFMDSSLERPGFAFAFDSFPFMVLIHSQVHGFGQVAHEPQNLFFPFCSLCDQYFLAPLRNCRSQEK